VADVQSLVTSNESRIGRIARPWRWAFVLYALAMTTGTHWPNLQFGPEMPATDKTIHLASFGALTALLFFTGWVRSRWLLVLIASAWACLDEWSQGMPGLNRTVSWMDLCVNILGVLVAGAWLWALGPVGLDASTRRRSDATIVLQEMFARPAAWIAMGIGAVAGFIPMAIMWPHFDATGKLIPQGVGFAVASITTWMLWRRSWNRTVAAIMGGRLCVQCGRMSPAPIHKCAGCGAALPFFRAVRPDVPPRVMIGRLVTGPAILFIASLVVLFGGLFLAVWVFNAMVASPGSTQHWALRITHLITTAPPEFTNAVDMAFYLLVFAAMVRMFRRGLSRWHDRAIRCAGCGYDLRATRQDEHGRGTCPECGKTF